ncbi:MAG: hypothetical protein RL226_654 [Bacteroidota bacterium]
MVAAGMFNPMSFRSIVPTWEAAEHLAATKKLYHEMEAHWGVKLVHSLPLIKVMPDASYAEKWNNKVDNQSVPFIQHITTNEAVKAPFGIGVVSECGYVDLPLLVEQMRSELEQNGCYTNAAVEMHHIVQEEDHHRWADLRAKCVVFAAGAAFSHDEVPVVPNKGEVLTVTSHQAPRNAIINHSKWLMPHHSGVFRLGATYERPPFDPHPSDDTHRELLKRIQEVVEADLEVVRHEAGIRPTSPDRKPMIGRLNNGVYVLNGLGTRGVLVVARTTESLLDHLMHGTPIPKELDILRFKK